MWRSASLPGQWGPGGTEMGMPHSSTLACHRCRVSRRACLRVPGWTAVATGRPPRLRGLSSTWAPWRPGAGPAEQVLLEAGWGPTLSRQGWAPDCLALGPKDNLSTDNQVKVQRGQRPLRTCCERSEGLSQKVSGGGSWTHRQGAVEIGEDVALEEGDITGWGCTEVGGTLIGTKMRRANSYKTMQGRRQGWLGGPPAPN